METYLPSGYREVSPSVEPFTLRLDVTVVTKVDTYYLNKYLFETMYQNGYREALDALPVGLLDYE